MGSTHYKTTFLEMRLPSAQKPVPLPAELTVVECEEPQYQFNRFLYNLVGAEWQWGDLDDWSDEQWREVVESNSLRTWVAYYRGSIAGYYELFKHADNATEIRYFGLVRTCIGKGFGGPLLSHAIQSAWDWNTTERVWVHTCTFDHPNALANYIARGLSVYREETTPL
ncbi:N-acetyltransferase [Halopseudomonas oceani]|uniref:GNAT family N-acetyltransferase n=1 Tax=Halopseudomonas oceani TaxID=1708783 RepID=A0A2P4EWX0_9GAMM|nr:GNAT family N-acetyltransferase [Halopseudomonas oceani]POB04507.1 GNAT family N-acetyltransferase [Halopseudomonas oceani]GGE39694.1 N-acetyltransferase [Halopseudomonas oceani]